MNKVPLVCALLPLFASTVSFAQAPAAYKPPPLALRQLIEADPAFDDGLEAAGKSSGADGMRKYAIDKANAGSLLAQIYVGEQYIPEECPHVPNATTTLGKCPSSEKNDFGEAPSFEKAFFWLNKASAQGSGEATEVLAQQTERMIEEHLPTTATKNDIARLHALARKQGFNDEKISITCTDLNRKNTAPLHIQGTRGRDDLSEAQVAAVRKVLPHGELGSTDSQSYRSEYLQHPEGPPATLWLLMDHPITHEVQIPMPLHMTVIAVQVGSTFTMVPANAPHNDRTVTLGPNDEGNIKVVVTQTNGREDSMDCFTFPKPAAAHK